MWGQRPGQLVERLTDLRRGTQRTPYGMGRLSMGCFRRVRQTLVVVATATACVFALSGCGPFASSPGVEEASREASESLTPTVSGDALVQEGTLTVGVEASNASAPYYIVGDESSADGENDSSTLSGMDVDLASALAQQLGLQVRFVSIDDPETALGTTCDVVFEAEDGDISGATVVGSSSQGAVALFHRGEAGTVTLDDVNGTTVGVQEGSVSQSVLENSNLSVTTRTYSNLNEAFNALEAGTLNYVLCDAYSGAYLAVTYGDIAFAGNLDTPVTRGVAVAESNTELSQAVSNALQTMSSGGITSLARVRWVGNLPELSSDTVISGVVISENNHSSSATTTAGEGEMSTDSGETFENDATPMDGSTAGSNAATLE